MDARSWGNLRGTNLTIPPMLTGELFSWAIALSRFHTVSNG